MRVNPKDVPPIQPGRVDGPEAVPGPQQAQPAESVGGSQAVDRVQYSARAQEVEAAREALGQLPATESARVADLRRLIAEGRYEVDGATLAEDMLRHPRPSG